MLQPLPSDESLLMIADILHNFLPNRQYDTLAVGAVGDSPLRVFLLVGINSSNFDETKLTKDRIMPPSIRNSSFAQDLKLKFTQEPYHAEISVLLAAKDMGQKIYGLASSRKICPICSTTLERHKDMLECHPVDCWLVNGRVLSQKERQSIESFDWNSMGRAKAIRCV